MKKFAASIPRKMFWSDRVPNKIRCPICKAKLENEYHTYVFLTSSIIGDDSFFAGNDHGRFCNNCPIVVLDRNGFNDTVSRISEINDYKDVNTVSYIVIGIVDIDAIPEGQRHLSLGDKENPVPLVEFLQTIERKGATGGIQRRLSGNQRRRLRKQTE